MTNELQEFLDLLAQLPSDYMRKKVLTALSECVRILLESEPVEPTA